MTFIDGEEHDGRDRGPQKRKISMKYIISRFVWILIISLIVYAVAKAAGFMP